jgi:hypothetical protein
MNVCPTNHWHTFHFDVHSRRESAQMQILDEVPLVPLAIRESRTLSYIHRL